MTAKYHKATVRDALRARRAELDALLTLPTYTPQETLAAEKAVQRMQAGQPATVQAWATRLGKDLGKFSD
jgi:hypothetical protein